MFVDAIKIVNKFTYPVIISKKLHNGKVHAGCAAYIILNKDGWALTAAHVLQDIQIYHMYKDELREREKVIENILNDKNLNEKAKKKKINQLSINPNAIEDISYWWGVDNIRYEEVVFDTLLDIGIVKLKNIPPLEENACPVFYDLPEENLPTGRSLCRTGFPFHNIKSTYDNEKQSFVLEEGTLPIPRFPNDGILVRGAKKIDKNSGRKALFIETSTPGLKGQSGGPIFDIKGRIWGVQSFTRHLELGFSPKTKEGAREVTEHQFLSIGVGVHAKSVIEFLQENNIHIKISNEE